MLKKSLFLLLSLFIVFLSAVSFAAEIDDINAAIAAKKLHWVARENHIHSLPAETRKFRAALLPSTKAATPATAGTQSNLPAAITAPSGSFDWRSNNGNNYVTSVKDQGDCGSCWAFSSTAALESYTLINGTYNPALNLAEQILVSCSPAGNCNGGMIDQAATYIEHTGLPPQSYDPYTASNSACSTAENGWTSVTDKTPVWEWISDGAPDLATIKSALYTYGPLVVTMNVYADFFAYQSGVYSYATGAYQGGHAILAVGYVDNSAYPGGGYFIVKNSWGTGWGMPSATDAGGYFNIAYGELTSVTQFAGNAIAYGSTAPSCSFSVAVATNAATNAATSGSDAVTTGSACSWHPGSSASWLTVGSTAAVTGPGAVKYTAAANTGATARTGTITIYDKNSKAQASFTVTQQAPVPTYTVTGKVSSGTTSVSNATVTLGSFSTTSASNGSFSFAGVPAGSYTIAVSATGYAPYSAPLAVAGNQSVTVALSVASWTISGTVRSGSSTGPALAGATVGVGSKTTTTATDGTFALSGFASGTYSMTIAKSGYVSYVSQPFAVSSNLAASAFLSPVTYQVSGTVTTAGTPVSSAVVTIGNTVVYSTSNGTYTLTGVAPGTYPVSVSKSGYTTWTGTVTVSSNTTLNIAMTPPTFTLSGVIHSGSMTGPGLAAATVSINGVAGKSALTDNNGNFTIMQVPPGTYTYTVAKSGYTSYTSGSFTITQNLVFNASLTLLPVTYSLSGTMRSMTPTGPLVTSATVYIAGQTITTNASGTFYAANLTPGAYLVSIVAQGYGIYQTTINVSANMVQTFCLAPQTFTLSGTVRSGSATGAPLAGATVSIAGLTATSASDGSFAIPNVPASALFTCSISKAGYTTWTSSQFALTANMGISAWLAAAAPSGK